MSLTASSSFQSVYATSTTVDYRLLDSSPADKSLLIPRRFPTAGNQSQMFNNYSALCYTAFIEAEVYTCTDSCMAEVRVHYVS